MFNPCLEPPGPSEGPPLVFAVRGTTLYVCDEEPDEPGLFLGVLDGRHCWALDCDGGHPLAEDPALFRDLRMLYGALDESTWTVAGRALQLVEWQRTHRFCGRCGTTTEPATGERALRCPECRMLFFPRLAPAVITLVERDDGRALLARGATFPVPMWSCLAGFVEPGETLEQAVAREVREEVGIEVDAITYRSSQPWPFPHSLMLGFRARYAGGEIEVDPKEIVEADWYAPDDLPPIPPPMSIARALIDDWIARTPAG